MLGVPLRALPSSHTDRKSRFSSVCCSPVSPLASGCVSLDPQGERKGQHLLPSSSFPIWASLNLLNLQLPDPVASLPRAAQLDEMGKKEVWDTWIKPRQAPSIWLGFLYGAALAGAPTPAPHSRDDSQVALWEAGWGNTRVVFEWGAAHGSRRHGNTAGNITPSSAPWPSRAGEALQTGDARVQDCTQSLDTVKCFIFMSEKFCSSRRNSPSSACPQ